MSADAGYPSNVRIWGWLVALLAVGLVIAFIPMAKGLAIVLIFAIAAYKAFLVGRHFMHLRSEALLIYAIAGIPVLLLIFMVLALVPDIVVNIFKS